jgi:hypothetical protein
MALVSPPSHNDKEPFLMPRVSEIEEDGGDPTLVAAFEKEREIFGDLLNPTKVMAHCPPILRAAKLAWRRSMAARFELTSIPSV